MTLVGADNPVDALVARNRAWANHKTASDPSFFARLVGQQRPRYFWIGCADSRVPATEIADVDPGEMFVHRNVANLARPDDLNFTAALLFAIDTLGITDILIVGHYGCGGIEATATNSASGPVGQWLAPVREAFDLHRLELMSHSHDARLDRLTEINVVEQIQTLARNPIVTKAWTEGRKLGLHGLVYGIGDGLLGHVCSVYGRRDGTSRVTICEPYQPVTAARLTV